VLFVWNLLLALCWPLLYFYRPFRGEIAQRLGRDLPDWNPPGPVPAPASQHASDQQAGLSAGRTFLINAVSAGEVVAIAPFIRELKRRQPDCRIVLLTTTDSGQEMARGKLSDVIDLLAYFPLVDLPWVVRRYLDRLDPAVYITTESELWPNIQSQCRARGIPVVSLNARIYLHNKRGLRGALVRGLYGLCDLIVCQSEQHYQNFRSFGIPADKLTISGNTKFDFSLPDWTDEQLAAWRSQWGLDAGTPVIVAGSTHPGEEELVLALRKYLPVHGAGITRDLPAGNWASVRLVLAPRHVERAPAVLQLARQAGYRACSLSEPSPDWEVLVVDRYGVLVDFYRLADVVIMGGTFSPRVGGHNILEATALGKPVLVGPYVYSIQSQVELLSSQQALLQADMELIPALRDLLERRAEAQAMGQRAQAATLASRGAADRAAEVVLALLNRTRPARS
jgi:3-deoxy-D-manno-octulosonic-acid transferase